MIFDATSINIQFDVDAGSDKKCVKARLARREAGLDFFADAGIMDAIEMRAVTAQMSIPPWIEHLDRTN